MNKSCSTLAVELERQIKIMVRENGHNPNKLVDHESNHVVEMWDC